MLAEVTAEATTEATTEAAVATDEPTATKTDETKTETSDAVKTDPPDKAPTDVKEKIPDKVPDGLMTNYNNKRVCYYETCKHRLDCPLSCEKGYKDCGKCCDINHDCICDKVCGGNDDRWEREKDYKDHRGCSYYP